MTLAPQPLFFGDAERPLFGWLHRAESPSASRLGVVLCNPFGYEAICAHRSIRHFAAAAARAGVDALRFDYDGTGDSAGDDRDPDRVAAWVASVHTAVAALREHAGCQRVCLLGFRLGASLAALAAAERDDIAGLIAVAPVASPRSYVRELRALQLASGVIPPPDGVEDVTDVQQALGFALTEQTVATLGKTNPARAEGTPASTVLILDRDDLPCGDPWAKKLAEAGVEVKVERLPGYVEMVLDPHVAVVPEALVDAAARWLSELAAGGADTNAGDVPAAAATRSDSDWARVAPGVRERANIIDGGQLFAMVTAPDGPTQSGLGILLLNAGSVHHIGPNRLYTQLARRWAAAGHVVVRLDNSGIGDSAPRPGEPENIVYSDRAMEDTAAAVAFLRELPGVTRCIAAGLCSGAYHAFKAAVAGQAVSDVVMINPLTFFWKPGMSLDYPAYKVAGEAERYARSSLSLEKWKKLLRGQIDVGKVAQTVVRHAASKAVNRARDVARRVGMPLPDDLGSELLTATDGNGIGLHFVFASGDPGLSLLRTQGGSVVPALLRREQMSIDIIEGPDHTFTPLWSHGVLTRMLDGLVEGVAAASA